MSISHVAALLFAFAPPAAHGDNAAPYQGDNTQNNPHYEGHPTPDDVLCVVLLPRPLTEPESAEDKVASAIGGDYAKVWIKNFPNEGDVLSLGCRALLPQDVAPPPSEPLVPPNDSNQ